MFQAIKNLIGSTNESVSKEDLLAASSAIFTALSVDIIPSFKKVIDNKEYFKQDTLRSRLFENLGSSAGIKKTSPNEVLKELLSFYKEISGEERNFNKLIDKNVSDTFFPKLATAQEAAIMATISDLSSIVLFSLDLPYYAVLDSFNTEYPNKKLAELGQGVNVFGSLVKVYIGKFGKHVDNLYKVTKTNIKLSADNRLMDKLFAKHGKLVNLAVINGFINNPIYHIRLWFVDRDIGKYNSLKEKKKLIELKLLELDLKASGKHDERLAKQIKYYEDKITGIESDIRDLEDN